MSFSKAQYLEKIASIITNVDLYLTVENDGSYVELGNFPIKVNISDGDFFNSKTFDRSIDIVKMAMDLNYNVDEFKLFIQRMMLYHECGHIKFTPKDVKYPVNDATMFFCGNFVEDARIESRMTAIYPPAGIRIELMNRILLDSIDISTMKVEKDNKLDLAKLSAVLAGYYFYGLTKVEPKSAIVKKMISVTQEAWSNPKMSGKHMVKNAKEIYDMIPGIDEKELEQDIESMMSDGNDNEEGSNQQLREAIGKDLKAQINREMKDIKRTIKAYGMEIGEKDERDEAFEKYVDNYMINQMTQQLCRILGAKPSKHDMMDFDGHSLDVESFLDYKHNGQDETKMYLKMGKRINPDFHISMCIDRSGSMGGNKMELAKKSVINMCLACEKVGIKTEVIDFDSVATVIKHYDQNIRDTEISDVYPRGGTIISKAIEVSMDSFATIHPDSKKAIIIVSDGWDGSGEVSAKLMSKDRNVKMYMIGIQSEMDGFISQFSTAGGRMLAFKNLIDMKNMGRLMVNFSTDFVRRNNVGG